MLQEQTHKTHTMSITAFMIQRHNNLGSAQQDSYKANAVFHEHKVQSSFLAKA